MYVLYTYVGSHARARASASKHTHHEDYCYRNNEITAAHVNGTIRLVSGRFLGRINRLAPSDMDITNCSRCLYLCGVRLS